METFETNQTEPKMGMPRRIKERINDLGRKIKEADLRHAIVTHPWPAVGIALGAGVLLGLARPRPRPHRLTGAMLTILGAMGFRFVREAAITYASTYAKELFRGVRPATGGYGEPSPEQR